MAIVLLRTVILYMALLVSMRLMGKRQLGEMELSEFVVASLIADLASHPLQDVGIPMINGLVPIFTLLSCEILIAGLTHRSVRLRELLFGRPSMLIVRGKINQKEMHANRFTLDELMQELRYHGMNDIRKVEYAILETSGQLNVLPFPSESPPSAARMGISTEDGGYPSIVINDGKVLAENLRLLGHDLPWLREALKAQGYQSAGEVYLMTVDNKGNCSIEAREVGS